MVILPIITHVIPNYFFRDKPFLKKISKVLLSRFSVTRAKCYTAAALYILGSFCDLIIWHFYYLVSWWRGVNQSYSPLNFPKKIMTIAAGNRDKKCVTAGALTGLNLKYSPCGGYNKHLKSTTIGALLIYSNRFFTNMLIVLKWYSFSNSLSLATQFTLLFKLLLHSSVLHIHWASHLSPPPTPLTGLLRGASSSLLSSCDRSHHTHVNLGSCH